MVSGDQIKNYAKLDGLGCNQGGNIITSHLKKVFWPNIIVGGEEGSIAIIGGADNPAQIVLFADLSVQGKFLTSIYACIFALNIFAFLRKPKD